MSRPRDAGGRIVLTDRALTLLARRDRTSVGVAKRRWSVALEDAETPLEWRNLSGRRTRAAAEERRAHLRRPRLPCRADGAGPPPGVGDRPARPAQKSLPVTSGTTAGCAPSTPTPSASSPEDDTRWPFFLEWERRAVRPSTMSARLAPYLRYFSSHRPTDDHGVRPAVLIVFDDDIAAHPLPARGAGGDEGGRARRCPCGSPIGRP